MSPRLSQLRRRTDDRAQAVKHHAAARLLPYQDVPLANIVVQTYRRDRETGGALVGSAVAFRVFQFFVPFLLLLVGAAGIVSGLVSATSVDHAVGVFGGLAAQIRAAFAHHSRDAWLVAALGLWGIAAAGRSLSRVLYVSSARAWGLPITRRPPLKVAGLIVGFILGIGFVVVAINRIRVEFGYAAAGPSFVPALAIYVMGWLGISVLLPRGTADPGALLPGSFLVGFTIAGMQSLSQFYLPGRLGRVGALYGTIGTTVVALGWFLILGRAISLAMVLNPVVYEKYGSISTAVFSLPVLRVLPRRSVRLRRFFDLEPRRPDSNQTNETG